MLSLDDNSLQPKLGARGSCSARRRHLVLSIVVALTVLALWPAWRTVSRPDVDLFNQPAGELQRFRLMRQMREDFGGDILAARSISPEIEQAARKIIKERAYLVLDPADVEVLRKFFEPQAIALALERVAATISALPPGSAEAVRLQEDPLGVAELAGETLRKRLALRREALAGVGYSGLPAVSVETPVGQRHNLILVAAGCFAGEFILLLVFFRRLMLAWHVSWATAALIIWTLAIAGISRGAGGLLGGAFACVLLGTATGYAIHLHNSQRFWGKRGARLAGLAAGLLALAGLVVFIKYGLGPGLEAAAGVRFDPGLSSLRSAETGAMPPRNRLSERFGACLADVRVLVTAADEDRAYAGEEEVARRLLPFIARGELSPGGGILDFVPSARQQQETIAALKTFDFTAAGKAFKAAAMERFGPRAGRFEPFLEWLKKYSALTREPAPLTLAVVMPTPLGNLLAPYVRLGPGQVLLASSWFPSRLDMPAPWYSEVARELETDPPQGVSIRVTAAPMVGLEIKHSLISLGAVALFGYIGALFGALVVLPALLGPGCGQDARGTEKQAL